MAILDTMGDCDQCNEDRNLSKSGLLCDKYSQCLCCVNRKIPHPYGHSLACSTWNCVIFILLFFTFPISVLSETVSPTTESSTQTGSFSEHIEDDNADVPKAVVTVAGLLVFFVAAFALAKLIDYCHDRRAIRDDASDISDYTKQLLKSQMMMMAFRRGRSKGKKLKPKEAALKFGKTWRAKVARNKARLMKVKKEAMSEAIANGKDPVKEVAKAIAIYEEKKRNANKIVKKETKKEKDLQQLKVDELDEAIPKKNEKLPPFPPASKPSETKSKDPVHLFVVNETNSEQKLKPSESLNSKNVPQSRASSRPISAGLKSRPVSAKSKKIFMNPLKK